MVIVPFKASAQFGLDPCCAIISAGLNTISGLLKSAVAKPTDGTEYHFEVRGNRVAFIDVDRLVEMVKTDARIRLRSGGQRGRLANTVGPVGK